MHNIPTGKIAVHLFLHFFNPDCPCSQFNRDHFRQVVRQYRTQANFYVIVQNDTEEELHKDLDVTVVTDDGRIAEACGVYATLQAVILNADRTLYYRGNYDKASTVLLNHSLHRIGFTISY